MGVVEIHTWNAAAPDLDHRDRIIFDLDPDPALPSADCREVRRLYAASQIAQDGLFAVAREKNIDLYRINNERK
ncbi:hypothetical protein [Paraburkholderia strydomiana]|uniref:non-homologous end-joining DNA ligase LigD n=1 Tax=Paraburkholderia strydomiana TaxID=1245417 RepID=UPI0020362CBB|nr:hypothetical protein [Paraburkholderia strydomiana]